MNNAIIWLRKTLRIHDNPMLIWAESSPEIDSVIPIYILDSNWNLDNTNSGKNRLSFLLDSLIDLDRNLREKYGTKLFIFSGNAGEIIDLLVEKSEGEIKSLLSDYCSEPNNREEMEIIGRNLQQKGINCKIFPAVNTILDIEKMTESKNFKSPKSTKDMEKIFEKNHILGPYGSLLEGDLPVPNKVHSESLLLDSISKNNYFSEYLVSTNEVKEYN